MKFKYGFRVIPLNSNLEFYRFTEGEYDYWYWSYGAEAWCDGAARRWLDSGYETLESFVRVPNTLMLLKGIELRYTGRPT